MKIAITCPASLPATPFGGILMVAVNLAEKCSEKNHEVTIYSTDLNFRGKDIIFDKTLPREEIVNKFKIKRSHSIFSIFMYFVNPKMYFELKKDNPDIIFSVGIRSFQSFIAGLVSKELKIPLVISDYGGLTTHPDLKNNSIFKKFLYKFQTPMIKFLFKQCSLSIAANEYEKNDFLKFVSEDKIKEIPNGIDFDLFQNEIFNFKEKFNINGRIILFVGRFNHIKGIDLLLKSFSRICQEEKFFDVNLIIMGSNFGYLKQMMELINELKIKERVKVLQNPSREDVISAYHSSEFLINPSRWELSPLTPLEGFACRKPSISSNFAGIPFVIEHGKTGLLIKLENEDEIFMATKLLLEDDELRKQLGDTGYNLVKDKLNSNNMVKQFLSEFETIIRKTKS